jgi:dCTP diphosphatase
MSTAEQRARAEIVSFEDGVRPQLAGSCFLGALEAQVQVVRRTKAANSNNSQRATGMSDSVKGLARALQQFAADRDWERFHSPKNLASALVVESGELLEHFQWLTEEQSRDLPESIKSAVAAEAADVLLYLVQLCMALGIDPIAAAQDKLRVNAERYPVERSRGTSKKYDQL